MAGPIKPLINGKRAGWSSIRANALGYTFTGISKIAWNSNQVIEDNMGAGDHAVDRSDGNFTYGASITLRRYEVLNLMKSLGVKRIQDIGEFDLVMAYIIPGEPMTTEILHNVRFLNDGRDISQGATVIETEYQLKISHVTVNP